MVFLNCMIITSIVWVNANKLEIHSLFWSCGIECYVTLVYFWRIVLANPSILGLEL